MALQPNKAIVRPSLVPRLEPSLPAPSLRHIKFSPIFQSGSSVPPSQTPNISSFEPNFVNFSSKDIAQMPHSMPTARGQDLQLRMPHSMPTARRRDLPVYSICLADSSARALAEPAEPARGPAEHKVRSRTEDSSQPEGPQSLD